jgi:transcriptional regulator with XRE-family HTH domain
MATYVCLVDDGNALGAFLRARRELLKPDEVGISPGRRRKVMGLRREEVAALAGISPEYYVRLEQGRDKRPSAQVLDALSAALRLDPESRAFAFRIAGDHPRSGASEHVEQVPAGLRVLMGTLNVPAFIMNKYRDVLEVNALATALQPTLVVGANRLVSLFTDPVARDYHPDWDANTASVVAQLRADVGGEVSDPRAQRLIGELSLRSERFRQLWARFDIKVGGSAQAVIRHPTAGTLSLRREKLLVEPENLTLVIYHAEPGTDDAVRLATLAPESRNSTMRNPDFG